VHSDFSQANSTIRTDNYVNHALNLCKHVYGMRDVWHPNNGGSYVGFTDIDKYVKKDTMVQKMFALPMIEKLF